MWCKYSNKHQQKLKLKNMWWLCMDGAEQLQNLINKRGQKSSPPLFNGGIVTHGKKGSQALMSIVKKGKVITKNRK